MLLSVAVYSSSSIF